MLIYASSAHNGSAIPVRLEFREIPMSVTLGSARFLAFLCIWMAALMALTSAVGAKYCESPNPPRPPRISFTPSAETSGSCPPPHR
ncbi:unnamed protein product [Urochloa humidicola]